MCVGSPPIGVFLLGCLWFLFGVVFWFSFGSGRLAGEFLVQFSEFCLKFFVLCLDLCFDKIMENLGVDGRFFVKNSCGLLGGGSVEE